MEEIDPYEILGVKEDATLDDIKKAYKNLAMKLHPDKIGTNPRALEQMKLVNEAYAIVKNKGIRKSFDDSENWDRDASIAQREKVWKEYSKQVEEYYKKLQSYLEEQLLDINQQKEKLSSIEKKLKEKELAIESKEKQLDMLLLHISKAYSLIVDVSKRK